MARRLLTFEEWVAKIESAPPPTSDDCTILPDGRRLDSRDAVYDWLAEVEAGHLGLVSRGHDLPPEGIGVTLRGTSDRKNEPKRSRFRLGSNGGRFRHPLRALVSRIPHSLGNRDNDDRQQLDDEPNHSSYKEHGKEEYPRQKWESGKSDEHRSPTSSTHRRILASRLTWRANRSRTARTCHLRVPHVWLWLVGYSPVPLQRLVRASRGPSHSEIRFLQQAR